jgi:predicted amidophosphoribosyltransferase
MKIPVVKALSLERVEGSSHPKTNVGRSPMRLEAAVVGDILLVDDVATSGRHLEEAALLLRNQNASVLPIAWIGGDADQDR